MKNVQNTSTLVSCPECGHAFDVNQSLTDQIKHDLDKHYQTKESAFKQQMLALETTIAQKEMALSIEKEQLDLKVKERVQLEKKTIEAKLKEELVADFSSEMEALKSKAKIQTEEIQSLKGDKFKLLQAQEELELAKQNLELEVKERMIKEKRSIQEEVKAMLTKEFENQQRDQNYLVEQLKTQISDLKRKAEQGSMQSQGEVLELEIALLVRSNFPLDSVTEVSTGVNGADLLVDVMHSNGRSCGVIAIESKRTKLFSDKWIDKLKQDMRSHKADVGLIITEAMPKDKPTFDNINGVWICKPDEAKGVITMLREGMRQVAEARMFNEHKGEKMQSLYNYMTSEEFRQQMIGIVEGFKQMRSHIDKERRAMQRIWAEREKQLDTVILNASSMHGAIRGLAGAQVKAIPDLDLYELPE